jgi:hypothetical protein
VAEQKEFLFFLSILVLQPYRLGQGLDLLGVARDGIE